MNILQSSGTLPPKRFQKTLPVGWLAFHNYYSRKPRDNDFSSDILIVTASYWRNIKSRIVLPLLEHNCEKDHSVSPSPPTKSYYVQTVHSNFSTTASTTEYVAINNGIKVWQPYFIDDYEKGSYK